jgi:hypothetical protein
MSRSLFDDPRLTSSGHACDCIHHQEAHDLEAKLAAAEANDKTSQDCAQKYLAERDDARAQVEELYKTDGWKEMTKGHQHRATCMKLSEYVKRVEERDAAQAQVQRLREALGQLIAWMEEDTHPHDPWHSADEIEHAHAVLEETKP